MRPRFQTIYRKRGCVFLKTFVGERKIEHSRNQTTIKTPHFRKLIFRDKHGF